MGTLETMSEVKDTYRKLSAFSNSNDSFLPKLEVRTDEYFIFGVRYKGANTLEDRLIAYSRTNGSYKVILDIRSVCESLGMDDISYINKAPQILKMGLVSSDIIKLILVGGKVRYIDLARFSECDNFDLKTQVAAPSTDKSKISSLFVCETSGGNTFVIKLAEGTTPADLRTFGFRYPFKQAVLNDLFCRAGKTFGSLSVNGKTYYWHPDSVPSEDKISLSELKDKLIEVCVEAFPCHPFVVELMAGNGIYLFEKIPLGGNSRGGSIESCTEEFIRTMKNTGITLSETVEIL